MIRQFRPEDAQACCSLVRACIDEDSSISDSLRRRLRDSELPRSMEERAKLFYVAVYESESGILGFVGLDMNEIRLLYVSPEHRREGIGRALFEHVAAMTPGYLFPDIFVYSSPAAVGFYKSLGFIEKGPASFNIDGEVLPTIFMVRRLGSSK